MSKRNVHVRTQSKAQQLSSEVDALKKQVAESMAKAREMEEMANANRAHEKELEKKLAEELQKEAVLQKKLSEERKAKAAEAAVERKAEAAQLRLEEREELVTYTHVELLEEIDVLKEEMEETLSICERELADAEEELNKISRKHAIEKREYLKVIADQKAAVLAATESKTIYEKSLSQIQEGLEREIKALKADREKNLAELLAEHKKEEMLEKALADERLKEKSFTKDLEARRIDLEKMKLEMDSHIEMEMKLKEELAKAKDGGAKTNKLDKQLKALQLKLTGMEGNLESKKAEEQKLSDKVAKYMSQNEDLKAQLKAEKEEEERWKLKVTELQNAMKDKDAMGDRLRKNEAEKDRRLQELEDQLAKQMKNNSAEHEETEGLRLKMKEFKLKLERTKTNDQGEIKALKDAADAFHKELDDAHAELTQLKASHAAKLMHIESDHQTELHKLEGRVDHLEHENEALRDANMKAKNTPDEDTLRKMHELEEQVAKEHAKEEKLRLQLEAARNETDAATKKLRDELDSETALRAQLAKLENSDNSERDRLQKQLDAQRLKMANLQNSLADKNKMEDDLKADLNKERMNKKLLLDKDVEEISGLKQRLEKMKLKLDESEENESRVKNLRVTKTQMAKQLADLQKETKAAADDMQTEMDKAEKTIRDLKLALANSLQEHQREIEDLKDAHRKNDANDLQEAMDRSNAEHDELVKALDRQKELEAKLKETEQKSHDETDDLKKMLANAKLKMKENEDNLANSDDTKEELLRKVQEAEKHEKDTVEAMEATLMNLENEIAKTKEQGLKDQAKIKDMYEQRMTSMKLTYDKALEDDNDKIQATLVPIKAKNKGLEDDNAALRQQLQEAEEENDDLLQRNRGVQMTNSKLKIEYEENADRVKELEEMIKKLKGAMGDEDEFDSMGLGSSDGDVVVKKAAPLGPKLKSGRKIIDEDDEDDFEDNMVLNTAAGDTYITKASDLSRGGVLKSGRVIKDEPDVDELERVTKELEMKNAELDRLKASIKDIDDFDDMQGTGDDGTSMQGSKITKVKSGRTIVDPSDNDALDAEKSKNAALEKKLNSKRRIIEELKRRLTEAHQVTVKRMYAKIGKASASDPESDETKRIMEELVRAQQQTDIFATKLREELSREAALRNDVVSNTGKLRKAYTKDLGEQRRKIDDLSAQLDLMNEKEEEITRRLQVQREKDREVVIQRHQRDITNIRKALTDLQSYAQAKATEKPGTAVVR